ncbi:MAG: prepilin-type N-terminal cleavage/methylation domain-containing protein [Candidatus Taylorbacteria bacterium]|nr:prepilin-type N-terminal cleavage/methylation domain-containing protein [Candidatus Taylorbacteria bacterium]
MNGNLGIKNLSLWKFRKKSSSYFKCGFSIVETLIAIAILSVAVVAPMSLAQRGLIASIYAKDQVTAFYLAQESVEYVRNLRDANNYVGRSGDSGDWLRGFDGIYDANQNIMFGIDVSAQSAFQIINCSSNLALCRLNFDTSRGIYGEQTGETWQSTIYTRTLQVKPFTTDSDPFAGADLIATVTWRSGNIQRSMVINEKIFNWYPAPVE